MPIKLLRSCTRRCIVSYMVMCCFLFMAPVLVSDCCSTSYLWLSAQSQGNVVSCQPLNTLEHEVVKYCARSFAISEQPNSSTATSTMCMAELAVVHGVTSEKGNSCTVTLCTQLQYLDSVCMFADSPCKGITPCSSGPEAHGSYQASTASTSLSCNCCF